jgi:hypothetical protein
MPWKAAALRFSWTEESKLNTIPYILESDNRKVKAYQVKIDTYTIDASLNGK